MTQLRCDHYHVCWMLRFRNKCKNDGQPKPVCMFDTRLHGNVSDRDKVLDELYPPNTRVEKNGDLYKGWEIDPKSLIRLERYIRSNPQYEEEPGMEAIEVVIRAIKHELKYGKVELRTAAKEHR